MKLTKEEENLILTMRKDRKARENPNKDHGKIVKVGTLKHDIYSTSDILEDDSILNSSVVLTRQEFENKLRTLQNRFNDNCIKKGTEFYCTIYYGKEHWCDKHHSCEDLTKEWAAKNLENIRFF